MQKYPGGGLLSQFMQRLEMQDAVLVRVHHTRGSTPREVGAWMAVFPSDILGTVGGGKLELDAITYARNLPGPPGAVSVVRYALGPNLGQCCGGEVQLTFEQVRAADKAGLAERLAGTVHPVAVFGGGHVGRALVHALSALPFQTSWIDSRDEVFPQPVPDNVQCEHSDPVQAAVAGLNTGTCVLIMSFSHAEDLDVVASCLMRLRVHGRSDLPFVGLIGSKTKWASFRQRLMHRGFAEAELEQITCPIGVPGIADKRPEVIAVAVAAQLLQVVAPSNP